MFIFCLRIYIISEGGVKLIFLRFVGKNLNLYNYCGGKFLRFKIWLFFDLIIEIYVMKIGR